ncbi:MAG: CoA-binding protein [Candidatus Hadarchaeales archaeon]
MAFGGLKCFFEPESVAVIGASREPGKLGHEILKNIIDAGFRGKIYPVNPKADEILGLKCYPSINDVPEKVDLAVIIVPARFVPSVVTDCGKKGVRGVVVISGGFREVGDAGAQLEAQLVEAAKNAGVRVVGPNCQGINSAGVGLCASWPLVKTKGSISVISQSGTVLAAIGCWAEAEGIGVSKMVALGNKCDVDEIELIDYLGEDEETKVIALYIEGTRDGRKFLEIARRVSGRKPIVVLKGGKTEKGAEAARSHTRSLAGLDRVFDAAFRKAGVLRVEGVEELYDACKAFVTLPLPKGPNVAIVTSSGGCGILATDACEELGLNVVSLEEALAEKLKKSLPPECIIKNPLDLTGSATSQSYDAALSELLAWDYIHSAIVIVGDPMPGISEVLAKHSKGGKPIIPVMLGGGRAEEEERRKLAEMKLPSYPSPLRGAKVLSFLWKRAVSKA